MRERRVRNAMNTDGRGASPRRQTHPLGGLRRACLRLQRHALPEEAGRSQTVDSIPYQSACLSAYNVSCVRESASLPLPFSTPGTPAQHMRRVAGWQPQNPARCRTCSGSSATSVAYRCSATAPLAPPNRQRDCHFTGNLSPSLLKHLLKEDGMTAE